VPGVVVRRELCQSVAMAATECPECGEKLGEQELICAKCGWPHEEAAEVAEPAATSAAKPISALHPLLIGLSIGFIVGLVLGWVWGHAGGGPAPAEAGDHGAVTSPGPSAPAPPPTLKLREAGWRAASGGLCMGMFQVVSAPPTITSLKFTAMDKSGASIATDKVSAPGGIKPGSMLELGFETGDCSRIQKWKVEVVKN
jgi:hypothetical protein